MSAHHDKYAYKRTRNLDRTHYQWDGTPKQPLAQDVAEGAAMQLTERGGGEMRAYECWCGSWHTGRMRKAV